MANPITNKVKKGKIPVIKKELDGGVVAEANNDGTIYLDKDIKKNSPKAKEAVAHEMVHIDQMARGDLNYDDNNVYWKGKEYPREIMNEGSKQLPWESEAYNKTENMKKSSPNKIKIGLSQDVLSQRAGMMEDELRMKSDKHAAIGRAVQQVESRVPEKLGGGGTGSWKKGGAQMNSTNKDKSPIKATPITAKTRSPFKEAPAVLGMFSGSGMSDSDSSSAADEVAAEAPKEQPESDLVEDTQKNQNQQGGGDDKKPDNTKEEKEDKEEKENGEEEKEETPPQPSTRVSYKAHSGYERGYNEQAAKSGKSPLSLTADEEAKEEISKQTVNVGDKEADLTTKKTTTKTRSQGSKDFEANCYNTDGSRKAEGTVVNGMTCSWAKDEDYDPESEFDTKVDYEDSLEYKKKEQETPGTPDKYHMGYHEAMDAKWSEGVRRRDKKQDARQSTRDRNKYDRNYARGYNEDGTPKKGKAAQRSRNRLAGGADGKPLTKDEYVASRTPEQADYNIPVGEMKLGEKGGTETVDVGRSDANKDLIVGEDGQPIRKNGELQFKKSSHVSAKDVLQMGNNKNKTAFKLKGWKAYNK